MKQSDLFTKTTKHVAKEEVSLNAQLLTRAGFIYKEMAGVYTYLPLGLRVLNNIINIIRQEMNAIGGQEILMNTLQRKDLWDKTNRWSDDEVDVWFKSTMASGTEIGLGWTHEEQITDIMTSYVKSYKDLPFSAYQVQTKFRNEVRAKSGILRTREFIMKDLYSFSKDQDEHDFFYNQVKDTYFKIFDRCGLGDITYLTFASGGAFSKFSHEFQALTEAGEDIIYLDEDKKLAVNKEVLNDEVLNELGLQRESLVEKKAAEVGNIFSLGVRFSKPLNLTYTDEKGEQKLVIMGSYGIGPARVMGVVAEALSDENGLIWPEEIAPFQVHLLALGNDEEVKKEADEIYQKLLDENLEVLYDDRNESIGAKLKDSDLIGIPVRLVVSSKTLASNLLEIKLRRESEVKMLPFDQVLSKVIKK